MTKQRKGLVLLLAGAVLTAGMPFTALADSYDEKVIEAYDADDTGDDGSYDPKLGDPNSDNTNLEWVSVDRVYGSIKGNDIYVEFSNIKNIDDFPTDPDCVSVKVEDGDKSYEVVDKTTVITGTFVYVEKKTIHDRNYAKVEDIKTEDNGRTWTFTVRAADGVTTEDYTIHVSSRREEYECIEGHDQWKWVAVDANHHKKICAVCGKEMVVTYDTDSDEYSGDHELELIEEGYAPTFENAGRKSLYECTVCGAMLVREVGRGEKPTLVTEADDIEEMRRVPSRNERRAALGYEPLKDYGSAPEEEELWEDTASSANGSWQMDATGWWFVRNDGSYPKNEWFECISPSGAAWYHFNASGYMDHGLFTDIDSNVYYLDDNAAGTSYGAMLSGWQWIGGKCYFFNTIPGVNGLPYGAMYRNATTPDGYTVNAEGAWVVNGVVQTK